MFFCNTGNGFKTIHTASLSFFGSQSRLQKPQLLLRCAYYCTTAFHFRPFRPTRNKRTGEKGLLKIKTQFKKGRQTTNLYILLDEPQLKLCTTLHTPKNGKKTFHINCHIKALNSQIKGVTLKVYTYLESISVAKRHCIVSVK